MTDGGRGFEPEGETATVLQTVLGLRMQRWREAAGVTREQAARYVRVSPLTIRRLEQAEVRLKIPYVLVLLELYGVDSWESEVFAELCSQSESRGWLQRAWDLSSAVVTPYVALEGEASAVSCYETHYVPGLLQTADYARAVMRSGRPEECDANIERGVELRMARQRRLFEEEPLLLWAILDEAVMHRPIGGPAVMRAQIDWLIEMCSLPHIRLQVVPFSSGVPVGADASFSIFSFPHPHLHDIAYTESLVSSTYLDRRSEVSAYRQAHERLADHASDADLTTAILKKARTWLA